MGEHLDPLVPSLPHHLSQFDIGVEIFNKHLEEPSLSLEPILHSFRLDFGLSLSLVWAETLD